jgi:hypothetical protein
MFPRGRSGGTLEVVEAGQAVLTSGEKTGLGEETSSEEEEGDLPLCIPLPLREVVTTRVVQETALEVEGVHRDLSLEATIHKGEIGARNKNWHTS